MTQFHQRHPLGYGSPRILLLLNLAYNASAMVHLSKRDGSQNIFLDTCYIWL
jgi:hypothetical protein